MLIKKACLALALVWALSAAAFAEEGGEVIQRAHNDVGNVASLQRGARNFMNYCSGCHSARYVRYNRIARDLGLTEEQVTKDLMFNGERIFNTIQVAMPAEDAQRWFGKAPPDLSLISRARGAAGYSGSDYIYSFLKSFYLDPARPTGANNLVLPNTAMPDVIWELQGLQKAVYDAKVDERGNPHKEFKEFQLEQKGTLSPEEFDLFARDTANFLDYIGEPIQLERRNLGIRVLAFLLVFFLFAYFLKKEYWKDVK